MTSDEVLVGGARGGGKTDVGIAWLLEYIDKPNYRALVIRRNSEDLADWVDRVHNAYRLYGAQIAYKPAVIKFPSGAIIRTGHLKDDQAYSKYQGHEYQRILIEELTQIPDERRYLQLIASCRTSDKSMIPQIFATTNPGGIGHGWVKARFVDPAPADTEFTKDGRTRIYIPATLDDNPYLMEADPNYSLMLDNLKDTDEQLWKAWRLGDWDVFSGMFFSTFRRDIHAMNKFNADPKEDIVAGFDWGVTAPFVLLGANVERVPHNATGRHFNRIKIFRCLTGNNMTPLAVGKEIAKAIDLNETKFIHADPSIFNKGSDMGESIATQMYSAHPKMISKLVKADNNRKLGLATIHQWLSMAPDGKPYMIISNNCTELLNQLGSAVYDEKDVEDINDDPTNGHHWDCLDALRYITRAVKWIDVKPTLIKSIPSELSDKIEKVVPMTQIFDSLIDRSIT